jgi:uncharacterized damage-inducible protein DinB
MPIANSLIAELTQEGKSTTRMLQRVPMDKLSWSPHPRSMPLGQLAWHIASIPGIAIGLLAVGAFDVANGKPAPMPEQPDFAAAYAANLDAVRASLAAMDDVALKAPFTLSRDGAVINELPKLVIIRSILMNHSYHHRGQLSVYLRLLDIPVPAIYGASADETMP